MKITSLLSIMDIFAVKGDNFFAQKGDKVNIQLATVVIQRICDKLCNSVSFLA